MDYEEVFKVELTEVNKEYETKQNMFETIGIRLNEIGYVKKSFIEAINTREQLYPTGLQMKEIAFAIPHTDVEHVNQPFVYVSKLKKPLPFIQMGTVDERILAKYIFILGIKEPKEQVDLLARMMDLMNNTDFIQSLKKLENINQINTLIKNNF